MISLSAISGYGVRYNWLVTFLSTLWTDLRRARDRSNGAWNRLYGAYRRPIFLRVCARVRDISEADAEDLSQTVFFQLSREGFLDRMDRSKGRFRHLVLAVTDHMIDMWLRGEYARRRKGPNAEISMADEEIMSVASQASFETSASYDQEWSRNIIEQALEALKRESERLKTPYYDAIQAFYFNGSSYDAIAQRLGVGEGEIGNYLSRGRKQLGQHIRLLIREYCRSEEEFEEELRALRAFLPESA